MRTDEYFINGKKVSPDKMIDYLVDKINQKNQKIQDLITWLEQKEQLYKEDVQDRETVLRHMSKESFYYLCHLKNIHKLNAKRELIKEFLEKVKEK